MSRQVVVVPHTHWDREWYQPYQTFRLRLVDLLDDLLPRLDADPSYRHFLLDGQMAVVDDYLAVRPEAEPVLRRLATAGRLAMGPWYILMDEFLVSGETMIRDLQLGLDRAATFGGAMEVGYLPDMFGHVAQMPQLLSQFGFDDAVVWRGVPARMRTPAFWWRSPDGSTVRAQYLPDGYSNGATLPDSGKELAAQIERFEHTYGSLAGDETSGPLLWMNGTDHQAPRAWLGRVVAEAGDVQDRYDIAVGSMADYLAAAPTEGLDTVEGELRSGAHTNLLMGVASNRVDVHQASAWVERGLERLAEPLSALWLPPDRWPAALLAEAWLDVIRNAAHDSVCACSVDEVSDAVLHRYAEAHRIAEGLTDRAVAALGRAVGGTRPVVVNPSARTRSGLVEVTVPGEGPIPGTQLVREFAGDRVLDGLNRSMLVAGMLGTLYSAEDVVDGRVELLDDGTLELLLVRDPLRAGRPWSGEARATVTDLATADPEAPARLVVRRQPGRRVVVRVHDVAGFGWKRLDAASEGERLSDTGVPPVTAAPNGLDNGLVRIDVDPATGMFSLDGHAGFGRLVDDGDEGDTYNWCPPAGDEIIDRPDEVVVEVVESGPLRAALMVRSTYTWPERIEGHARVGARRVEIATRLELHAGERLVRVTTELDNPSRDHRLRVWFPLPEPATESRAECAFAVVARGLVAEGGPTEAPLATYPSRRFVQAGGLTVVHEGLLEYELVDLAPDASGTDRARSLALTLLRATGCISRGPMATRPLPAGPGTLVEGPQMIGHHRVRYALQIGDADPYALVDDAFLPLLVADPARIRGMADVDPASADDEGRALDVRGAEVSSVRCVGAGALEVRAWNASDEARDLEIVGRTGWLTDLRGAPVQPFDGRAQLGPWRIATVVLTDTHP
jgi:mannosylglycerate hydrolase